MCTFAVNIKIMLFILLSCGTSSGLLERGAKGTSAVVGTIVPLYGVSQGGEA